MEKEMPAPIDLISFLRRLIKGFFKLWPIMLILIIILSGYSFLRAKRSFVPMYESKARFSVSSGYSSDDIFSGSYYYDNTAAQQLAESFPHLLKTDMMRELISEQLGTSYINGTISAQSVADTNMMVLSVTSNSPQDAYDVLCAVIDCYPQVAVYTVDNPQVIIRELPQVPSSPYNSFSWQTPALKGAVTGFALGAIIIFVYSLFASTVDSPDELKKTVNLPILASFPLISHKKRRKSENNFISAAAQPAIAEALRGLRVKVLKLDSDITEGARIIAVTSTLPGEGKTTVATNLALSLAEDGHKTVLVDVDFRHQSALEIFGDTEKKSGFMDCLENSALDIKSCLRKISSSELQYISGESTDVRHYRVDTKSIRRRLAELGEEFEYIILDTPPCGVVSDTPLICRCADDVLFVVKQGYAKKSQIIDIVTSLHDKNIRLAGCIINATSGSSYRYGCGYGYGYGYGRKTTHSKPSKASKSKSEFKIDIDSVE